MAALPPALSDIAWEGSHFLEKTTGKLTHFPNDATLLPNEATLRCCIIAQGIKILDERLRPNSIISLVYPPLHWKRIKYFLQHPEQQEQFFLALSHLKIIPGFDEEFFRVRKWRYHQNGWERVSSIPI